MATVYVQFNEALTKVITVFGGPQPEEILSYWPNYAEIDESDPRYQAWLNPQPTPEEILEKKQVEQKKRMDEASIAMTPIYMALQLGDSDDETTQAARAWRDYYNELKAVDLSAEPPVWPTPPGAENA